MNIGLFGGKVTDTYTKVLQTRLPSMSINGCPNIGQDLHDIEITGCYDILVFLTHSFFNDDDKQYNLDEVFKAIAHVANNPRIQEVILITTQEQLHNAFSLGMMEVPKSRSVLLDQMNAASITAAILDQKLDTFKQSKSAQNEVIEQDTIKPMTEQVDTITSIQDVQPNKVEVKETVQVEEKEEPKVQPKEEKVLKKKQKATKSSLFKQSRVSLKDTLRSNKIVLVTGNPSSGVTGAAYDIWQMFANDNVDTLLIDADIYNKGINLYEDGLNTAESSNTQKVGLLNVLSDWGTAEKAIFKRSATAYLLGLETSYGYHNCPDFITRGQEFCDMLQMLTLDYSLLIVHMPIDILLSMPQLLSSVDTILYCVQGSINGLTQLDRYLNLVHYPNGVELRNMQLIHKKLKYVLTNLNKTSLANVDTFLGMVQELLEDSTLNRPVLYQTPSEEKYDCFNGLKVPLIQLNKKYKEQLHNALITLFS